MSEKLQIGWVEGSHIRADAEKVYGELETIQVKTPRTVLEYAQENQSSELHSCFEWDDAKAAGNWRLEQAGQVLRSIAIKRVVYESTGDVQKSYCVRAYENVDNEGQRQYIPLKVALSNNDFSEQVQNNIKQAITDLRDKGKDYQNIIKNATGFFYALDKALEAI
jgi:hypothetical protein